jgi:PAS domain S-box-containing protein
MIEGNQAMISILNLDKLLYFLVDKMVNTISIESAVFFLKEADGSFTLAAEEYLKLPPPVQADGLLKCDNPLVNYLQEKASIMLFADLNELRDADKRELLSREMKRLGAEAAVPVLVEGRLEAILFLGYKQSGDPYSREDVHLFSALALQVAVALKNAQLYYEILSIKQYLENILRNMGNGLIAVDAQGRITTFNSSAKKLTGILPHKEVLGRDVEKVLEPVLSSAILHTLKSGRNISEVEIELHSALSSSFLCCSTARAGPLGTGEQGAIMVLSDLTRIKELEREKNQTEKLASLGKLAAGIAHEIKNPLVSIKTFAELLPEKYDDYEFRHTFSQIAIGEIERINKLIMELLNFSRDNRPSFEKVDIWELAEEVLLLLFPRLDSQKIRLHKYCHGDLLAVKADREQMKQALFNICVNAVQAMPDGGELWVEVSAPVSDAADKLKIMIKDTGPGIAPERRNRIFDPFYTTKPDGVGMGLSISHRVITDHGGSVQFSSSSTGTVFEIYLPLPAIEGGEKVETGSVRVFQK